MDDTETIPEVGTSKGLYLQDKPANDFQQSKTLPELSKAIAYIIQYRPKSDNTTNLINEKIKNIIACEKLRPNQEFSPLTPEKLSEKKIDLLKQRVHILGTPFKHLRLFSNWRKALNEIDIEIDKIELKLYEIEMQNMPTELELHALAENSERKLKEYRKSIQY